MPRAVAHDEASDGPPSLTADEVAERLNVSRRFVHDSATELGVVKIGRLSRFDADAVEAYINVGRVAPARGPTPRRGGIPTSIPDRIPLDLDE